MSWNVCEYIESRMIDQFGFEGPGQVLQRRVDDQHVVQMTISPFNRGSRGHRAGVEFALGRRDINELWIELRTEFEKRIKMHGTGRSPWAATVLEVRGEHRFLGRPDGHWIAGEASERDVDEFLERWVPQLDGIANLPFIEQYMAMDDPEWDQEARDVVKLLFWTTDVANRMLSGWSPEGDEHLLQWRLDSVAHFDPDSRARVGSAIEVETVRAWIAENPDGVERELTSI